MYLKWTSECYLCECPLDPHINTKNAEERIIIREFRKLRPIFTVNNELYLKFFNMTIQRVCYACYLNSYNKIHPSFFRDRECGRIKNIFPQPKSKTKEELLYWYEDLKRYLSKRLYT